MLPTWSGCLWVSTTCRTPAHPGPASSSTSPIASALPPTPVSTTAASRPRTSTYADTKPRFTRDQATWPASGVDAEPVGADPVWADPVVVGPAVPALRPAGRGDPVQAAPPG